jgi:hypothetical protein
LLPVLHAVSEITFKLTSFSSNKISSIACSPSQTSHYSINTFVEGKKQGKLSQLITLVNNTVVARQDDILEWCEKSSFD